MEARSLVVISLVSLIPIFPAGLAAQAELTEEDYLAGVDENHPALAALAGEVGAAEAGRLRAATLANPLFGLEREAPSGSAEETTLRLVWAPPLDGRRRLATEAAEAGVAVAEHRTRAARLGVRSALRAAFARWALAERRAAELRHHAGRARDLAEIMGQRAARGEASGLDARRLELAVAQARGELALAEAELARAREAARVWRPDLAPGARPVTPALPPVPERTDPSRRPDLEARRSELEQARLEARLGRRFLRFPELTVGWKQIEGTTVDFDGPVLGVGWRLPLFDRDRAARLEAETRAGALEAALELGTARARAEVAGARAAYEGLRRAAHEALEAAGEAGPAVAGASAAYRLGESGLAELLETLRSALAAELTALDLHAAALQAHRELEAAVGRPLTRGDEP